MAAGPVLPLTVDQLNALMATDLNGLIGRRLIIAGTLRGTPVASCLKLSPPARMPAICISRILLVGSSPELEVKSIPADEKLADITTFSAVLTDLGALEYDATVATTATGGAWLPSQLPDLADRVTPGQDWLVHGWIAGPLDATICPAQPAPTSSGPQYGCGNEAVLTDLPMQLVTDNSITSRTGIRVQDNAYQDFALQPGAPGTHSITDLATFLVDEVNGACPPSVFCTIFGGRHWRIVARLDPWPLPTPGPSTQPPAPSPDPGIAVRPLTVDQLNLFMRMNSQSPSGRQLMITGTIGPNTVAMICVAPCTGWVLEGSDPTLYVQPVGDVGPGPWSQKGAPLTGTFAATLVDGYRLNYQGPVSTTLDGDAWLPSQLPLPSGPNVAVGYWLVHGWIGGPLNIPSCVYTGPSPYPGPQYTCAEIQTLRDGPDMTDLEVRVQNDAYGAFAPSPTQVDSGTQPEQATFLIHVFQIPRCGPTQDCMVYAGDYQWAIVARIDPWPVPALP